MKFYTVTALMLMVITLLAAGCTSPVISPPPTVAPTTATPAMPEVTPAPVTDPELIGTWTVTQIAIQGGNDIMTAFNVPITATFYTSGSVMGNGGCNNYNAQYTLSGEVTPFGKAISFSPVTSTKMNCVSTINTENTYFQILQNANSYAVEGGQTLSIRDRLGSVIVYKKG